MGKLRSRKFAALGVALLLAGPVVWLVCNEAERQTQAEARAAHARAVLAALDGLAADLEEASACRCAYVTRIEPAQRAAFRAAARRAGGTLEQLRSLIQNESGRRSQLSALSDLVERELELLERSLRLRDRNRFNDRGQLALTRQVQRTADSLHRALAALRSEEDRVLARQKQQAQSSARRAETVVGTGALLVALGLTLSAMVVSRKLVASERCGREAARRAEEQSARLGETQAALAELASLRGGLEEQLRQAQRLASVGRVTSGVAHDFNNLLTLILGCSEASLRALSADDPSRPFISEVVQAGRRAAVLTRRLLGAGRGGELARLDLNQVLAEAEPLLRRLAGRDVELVLAMAVEVEPVYVDPGQLDQVLLNLVANARDAMPQGGKLTLETHPAEGDVVLAVTDTGCGMDAPTRARVFEPFFSTKGQGTGLGMAIVQDAVRHCGGRVEVDSEPGRGTTVRIYLPRADGCLSR